jgi:hypothetical protein
LDKATGKVRPIYMHMSDGDNPNAVSPGKNPFCHKFTASGDLDDTSDRPLKTHVQWLQGTSPGPFMWKDFDYNNKKCNFILDGYIRYCGQTKEDYDGLVVCEGNYISNNCSGGICWVPAVSRKSKTRKLLL